MQRTENRKDFDLNRLLHPAGAFRTPMEVVNDPDMTIQEKRAILASWASDACAVEASPDLRQPPSAPIIRFDDIMDALKRLDDEIAGKPRCIKRVRRWKDLYRGRGPAGNRETAASVGRLPWRCCWSHCLSRHASRCSPSP